MRRLSGRVASLCALLVATVLVACTPGCTPASAPSDPNVVRIGHFPNVTHAHGLVGHAKTRAGGGWFEERLGEGRSVEWYVYNAGPSAMEALIAGSIDATYVGPNPAINAYLKAHGQEVRVLAGATRGGSALVVQGDSGLSRAEDFRGKRVATPQLGNTQDVACRAWLRAAGLEAAPRGNDVTVIPTQNPDQLALFKKGDLDAVWTVEPWVTRLEREAGGKVLLREDDACTTILVVSARFLRERPEDARRLVRGHRELTDWIVANAGEAKRLVRGELRAETRQDMPAELLDQCWPRLRFDTAVDLPEFERFVRAAQAVGYLQDAGDLSGLVPLER